MGTAHHAGPLAGVHGRERQTRKGDRTGGQSRKLQTDREASRHSNIAEAETRALHAAGQEGGPRRFAARNSAVLGDFLQCAEAGERPCLRASRAYPLNGAAPCVRFPAEEGSMAVRDHYASLGVGRTESAAGIRAAFRDLVKRYHPDRAGPEGAERFREVAEAYRVLGDPALRRAHDDDLRRAEGVEAVRIRRGRPAGGDWVEPEPLVPEPLDVLGTPDEIQPSFEALFDRLLRNFTGRAVPKAERTEGLTCNVVLSPEEAARGGVLPIQVPVFARCPSCSGTGHGWAFPCIDCGATGIVTEPATIRIRIPPGVRSGSRFAASLAHLGIGNLALEVLVRIGR